MTHRTLMEMLHQETAELDSVVEAVEEYSAKSKDNKAPQWLEQELCQELSDVLLQVLFHAEIANRRGAFDIGHVSGAFVAKLRSRAPYLFEQVERDVPRTEQDRLWAEGKRKERAAKLERLGEPYRNFLKDKDAPAQATQNYQQPQSAPASEQTQPAHSRQQAQQAAPQVASALVEAENVIRRARQMGLPDSKIPTDIRFPMVGLELDEPGEADRRLFDAVRAFHQQLDDTGGAPRS